MASALAVGARAGAAGSAAAAPEVYDLDPDHSQVWFEVLHFGTSTLRGRFAGVEGAVTLDRAAGSGEVGIRIATASVATGLRVLDARLRQADLLASVAYPEAYFVAQHFRFEGGQPAEVRGEFTWRGVSRPLSLTATHFACRIDAGVGAGPSPGESASAVESGGSSSGAAAGAGATVCGGDFEADFKRSDFASTFGLPFVADRVHLRVSVEGRRR